MLFTGRAFGSAAGCSELTSPRLTTGLYEPPTLQEAAANQTQPDLTTESSDAAHYVCGLRLFFDIVGNKEPIGKSRVSNREFFMGTRALGALLSPRALEGLWGQGPLGPSLGKTELTAVTAPKFRSFYALEFSRLIQKTPRLQPFFQVPFGCFLP